MGFAAQAGFWLEADCFLGCSRATWGDDKLLMCAVRGRGIGRAHGWRQRSRLMAAAHHGRVERVSTLVAMGAPLEQRDVFGATAMTHAVCGGHADVAALLVANGAAPFYPVTGTALEFVNAPPGHHGGSLNCLLALPDGRLGSGGGDGLVRLWRFSDPSGPCESTVTGHRTRREQVPKFVIWCMASVGECRLAVGCGDGSIRIVSTLGAEAGAEKVFSGQGSRVLSILSLPEHRIAVATGGGAVRVLSPATGACELSLAGHMGAVRALVVLPDGRLASVGDDKTVRVWRLHDGGCEATLSGHTEAVMAVILLPDGRIATGSEDTSVRIWRVSTGACEATLLGHTGMVYCLAVLPDGRLASGSADGTARIWSPSAWRPEVVLCVQSGAVYALAVLGDGRLAMTAGKDIVLWA